jgi:hypothetical protein
MFTAVHPTCSLPTIKLYWQSLCAAVYLRKALYDLSQKSKSQTALDADTPINLQTYTNVGWHFAGLSYNRHKYSTFSCRFTYQPKSELYITSFQIL